MRVELEFFFTKIIDSKVCYWKNNIDITEAEEDPDNIVLKILESDINETPKMLKEKYIVHSTSWRYEEKGLITLMYLVYSDHLDFGINPIKTIPFNQLRLAISTSYKKPRPQIIKEENVISHAVRHLAYLVKDGNYDSYKKCLTKETVKKLKELKSIPAGEI